MAEGKKGIIVYADWIDKFELLEDAEAGRLIKHFFRFVNDLNPVAPDRITELSFVDIKKSLHRDLVKWENAAERSRLNGKLGGRPSKEKPTITQQVILEPRKPVNVNVNVNDKEEIIALSKKCEEVVFSIEHCLVVALNDNRWVKANTATRIDLMAFNEMLEQRGVYQKNPGDYKTHYSNWVKTKSKTPSMKPEFNTASTSPPLKRINFG